MTDDPQTNPIYTITELCRRLHVGRSKARRMILAGHLKTLPRTSPCSRLFFTEAEVIRYLARGTRRIRRPYLGAAPDLVSDRLAAPPAI